MANTIGRRGNRQHNDYGGGESELTPRPLIAEYEENGIRIRRFAAGYAIGVKPARNIRCPSSDGRANSPGMGY